MQVYFQYIVLKRKCKIYIEFKEIASRGREYIENDRDIAGDFRMTMITNLDNVFASDYVQANRIRTKFMKITEILFQKVDLIATPTTREGAMKRYPGDEICMF